MSDEPFKLPEEIPVEVFRDRTIVLTTGRYGGWRFKVTDEDFVDKEQMYGPATYPSLDEAKKAIERVRQAEAKLTLEQVKLDAYDDNGRSMTIVGLHRGTGNALVRNYAEGNTYAGNAYPAYGWVQFAILERNDLYAKAREIDARLGRVAVRARGYGKISAENYNYQVSKLVNEWNKAEAKAKRGETAEDQAA